jgi:hypothetical protein
MSPLKKKLSAYPDFGIKKWFDISWMHALKSVPDRIHYSIHSFGCNFIKKNSDSDIAIGVSVI